MRRRILSSGMLAFVLISIGISVFIINGSTWKNGGNSADPSNPDYGTHDWIAQHALDWLPANEKQYILDNLATYLYGTELPDNNQATDGIGDTFKHHVYYWSNGSLQDDAAADRASEEYYNTLNFLKAKDYTNAAKNAGIMSHYIVDMAVFGHVMGSSTDWGTEMHHSDYETYVNNRTSSYVAEFNSYLSFDGSLATISAYDTAKNLAFDTTFDVDGDLTCVWMNQNYDWNNPTFKNRAGESLNLAVNYLADVLHTLYLEATLPPWGDWKHYHNYTEIVSTLQYLNSTYPTIIGVFSVGKSWQNQDIYGIRLTNENMTHPKPKVFFVGYHHAREPISAELPLYFLVETAEDYGTNTTITRMLDYAEIYVIVALNVDAFDVAKQNEWQRKNVHPFNEDEDSLLDEDPPDDEDKDGYIEYLWKREGVSRVFIRWEGVDDDGDGQLNEDWVGGVDLNRNYGYQWNATVQSGSPDPKDEAYRGPEPFSEPETKALRDFAMQHDFKYAISLHSGAEIIVYPWGHTTAPAPHDQIFREVASNLSALVGATYGQEGAWYTTSGNWDDWMYGNRSTFALTCEIYTNTSAWQREPGPYPDSWWERGVLQAFSPNPSDIEIVIKRWLPVFTYITNRAIIESDTTPPTTTADYDGSWRKTDFTISLSATDDFSGVAETYYKISDGSTKTVSADGQPFIAAEGANNTLEYWSLDNFGSEETPHKVLTEIKLDKTAPSGSVAINNDASYVNSASVTLTLTATDALSGVGQIRFSHDNSTWTAWETYSFSKIWTLTTGDETKTVYAQLKDKAGLLSQPNFDTIILDTTAPTLLITSPSPGYQIRSSQVAITWAGSDETSGISHYEIKLNDGAWINVGTNTTHTFTELGDGGHTIDVKANDAAGNSKLDTINFTVNTSPLLGPGYIEETAITTTIIIAAIGITLYILKSKKHKPNPNRPLPFQKDDPKKKSF